MVRLMVMTARAELRRQAIAAFGYNASATDEVLAYCDSPFDIGRVSGVTFPLADEPHVADWRNYRTDAGADVFSLLQERLPQLAIPIADGMSTSPAYAAVVRRGRPFFADDFGGRLTLDAPAELSLEIHEHPTGALPVLVAATRHDFERLYRALAHRNEPIAVNPSVNAQMIAGIVNWDRVNRYRQSWADRNGADLAGPAWSMEMSRVASASPELFYDRLILTTRAPYGGCTAEGLGLDMTASEWQRTSAALRVEHEFAHYATKRLYGAMRLNLLDELIADAMGMTHALGEFDAGWFLGALGLAGWPALPATARVHTYRSGLSDEGLRLACEVAAHAAEAVEALTATRDVAAERGRYLLTLTALTLDVLASSEAADAFDDAWELAATVVGDRTL